MRLSSISFTNFRCFSAADIDLSDYTALVGPNNCGKSTVMRAINIFVGEGVKAGQIDPSDFSVGTEDNELKIRLEFSGIDGHAADDLSHYVRDGRLAFELLATKDDRGLITSKCRGIRYGLPHLAPFFAAQKAGERRPIYEQLIADGAPLPRWQNMEAAETAVRDYEQQFTEEFVAIPSDESAYGATGPLPILRKHLDWIYVPAVKDVSAEASEQRNSAFSKLILYAIRAKVDFSEQIEAIRSEATERLARVLDETGDIVSEVGGEIDREFRRLTTAPINISLQWDESQSVVLREPGIRSIFKDGDFFDTPENFGHGVQRTYIMALLSVAAKVQNQVENFNLILGVEEPELYQHPPQARFLSRSLSSLADGRSQVILTTHSPFFVTGRNFESIRCLRKRANRTSIHSWTIDEQRSYCARRKDAPPIGAAATLSGLDRSLLPNIAEMFFANKLVLVEGAEDEAIITSYLSSINMYSDFLMHGGHIVPVGGKSKMPMLLALSRGMSIDTFCVFDFDMNVNEKNRSNSELIRYAQDADIEIPNELDSNFSSDLFFANRDNIQISISQSYPSWNDSLKAIAEEWGWDVARMGKDPMVLQEAVHRMVTAVGRVDCLDDLANCLHNFWRR